MFLVITWDLALLFAQIWKYRYIYEQIPSYYDKILKKVWLVLKVLS